MTDTTRAWVAGILGLSGLLIGLVILPWLAYLGPVWVFLGQVLLGLLVTVLLSGLALAVAWPLVFPAEPNQVPASEKKLAE